MSIYNPPISPFSSSWVVASTSQPNTSLRNVMISPSSVFTGNYPILSFETSIPAGSTLSGSWTEFQTAVQKAQLEAQTQSMLTTKGGLLIAETSTTSNVAALMGNSTVATWLNFIDGSTTGTISPQVGSEGNDIVLCYDDGTVAFRGSGTYGAAIIGNSTRTETFSTNTALSGTDSLAAFEVRHTGAMDPQGIIVNFRSAAVNNKVDPAFGFQDTASSSFKTVIWSDGSVAHQVFGFNVSEFQTLPVSSTISGTYQIASGAGLNSLLEATYELAWVGSGAQQHMVVAVGCEGYDSAGALVTVLHNYCRGGVVTISNPRVVRDGSHVPYFIVTLSPTVPGTLNVQARGYSTGIALSTTPGGTITVTNTEVTLNQTGGGSGNVLATPTVSGASSNTITNKIPVEIGGTTYYLLASTLSG